MLLSLLAGAKASAQWAIVLKVFRFLNQVCESSDMNSISSEVCKNPVLQLLTLDTRSSGGDDIHPVHHMFVVSMSG